MKRQVLGRGLSALISEDLRKAPDLLSELEVDSLSANHRQPRTVFSDAALDELARSIKTNGFLQPIVVRRDGRRLEIVAGERRWRAAKLLGMKKIPAILRDLEPQHSLEAALVENLQREDLNPIDEARAYEWLIQDYGLTQEEVAERVGKDRSTVTNILRLLRLPMEVQEYVASGKLSMGHARALLGVAGAVRTRELAERVIAEGLSVRKVEALVRAVEPVVVKKVTKAPTKDVHDRSAEKRLMRRLGTKVTLRRGRRGGKIEVSFHSEEELQRLFDMLVAED